MCPSLSEMFFNYVLMISSSYMVWSLSRTALTQTLNLLDRFTNFLIISPLLSPSTSSSNSAKYLLFLLSSFHFPRWVFFLVFVFTSLFYTFVLVWFVDATYSLISLRSLMLKLVSKFSFIISVSPGCFHFMFACLSLCLQWLSLDVCSQLAVCLCFTVGKWKCTGELWTGGWSLSTWGLL